MAKQLNKYLSIWGKYKPAIVSYLKAAKDQQSEQQYQLSPQEFTTIGDRDKSGYSFKLDLKNGAVINDIGGGAVAHDLVEVLRGSPTACELFKNSAYHIKMDKNFRLFITREEVQEEIDAELEMSEH